MSYLRFILCLIVSASTSTAIAQWNRRPTIKPFDQWTVRFSAARACSGVIIGDHSILTAAHCFEGIRPENRDVLTFSNRGSKFSTRISGVIVNPDYRIGFADNPTVSDAGFDLAVIKTTRSLVKALGLTDLPDVSGIDVPIEDYGLLKVRGYGDREDRPSESPTEFSAKLVNRPSFNVIEIEGYWPGQSTCVGDSGAGLWGSALESRKVLGIISSRDRVNAPEASKCGDFNRRAQVILLSSHRRWLAQIVPEVSHRAYPNRRPERSVLETQFDQR